MGTSGGGDGGFVLVLVLVLVLLVLMLMLVLVQSTEYRVVYHSDKVQLYTIQ